jgi:hypothetical protein
MIQIVYTKILDVREKNSMVETKYGKSSLMKDVNR